MKKKMNKKGFTLPEVLIAFLLIMFVTVWVVRSIPSIKDMSAKENHRLIAIMRNIEILESTRYELQENKEIKRFSTSELSGGKFGKELYYVTTYDYFESSHDIGSSLDKTLKKVLDADKYPELIELVPRAGSNSELYKVSINTRVGSSKVDNTRLTTFMYNGNN